MNITATGMSPWRRRTARVVLSYATVVSVFMVLSLPAEVWSSSGSRDEEISFIPLLAVAIGAICAHVAIALRRRGGQAIAFVLGAYAAVMLALRGVDMVHAADRLNQPAIIWSNLIAGTTWVALIIAAVACFPHGHSVLQGEGVSPAE